MNVSKVLIGGVVSLVGLTSILSMSSNNPASATSQTRDTVERDARDAIDIDIPSNTKPSKPNNYIQDARQTDKVEMEIEAIPPRAINNSCHPGYSGCLKRNASDYDCAGGSGNGPYYTGPVRVYGSDPFGLDRDNDGWGCE